MPSTALCQVLLLALALHTGESLKCYTCVSENDPKCADPLVVDENKNNVKECSEILKEVGNVVNTASKKLSEIASSFGFGDDKAPPTADVKLACIKIVGEMDDKKVVHRSCTGLLDGLDACASAKEKLAKFTSSMKISHCSTCETDGCNGTSGVQATFMAIILPLAAIMVAQFC